MAMTLSTALLVASGATGSDQTDPTGGVDPTLDPGLELAVDALDPAARALYPDTYAGIWLGELGDGRGVQPGEAAPVTLAFTEGADARVGELARSFPRPDLLRAATVDDSLRELEATDAELRDDRDLVSAGQLTLDFAPSTYDIGIDLVGNANVVTVEESSPALEQAFRTR